MKIRIFNFCLFISRVCGCQWFINNPIRFLKKRYLWTALTDLNHFNSIFDFCLLFTFLWRVFSINKGFFVLVWLKPNTFFLLSHEASTRWSVKKLLSLLCDCYNIKSGSFLCLSGWNEICFFSIFEFSHQVVVFKSVQYLRKASLQLFSSVGCWIVSIISLQNTWEQLHL